MAKGQRKFLDILERRPLILDGATGTELQKRGMPPGVSPELWCAENPGVIAGVHRDYARAGADAVYTCTFGANRFKLEPYGEAQVRSLNRRLALIARQAVGGNTLVVGDIGPTGRFIRPFGELDFEEAVGAFKEQVRGLLDGGVDGFVGVGEERVISPDREQCVGVAGVFDAAHDQPGSHRIVGGTEGGVGGFGDFGIGDPGTGVGIAAG